MPTTHTVVIKDHTYDPAILPIEAGDSVVWENQDNDHHTADGSQFEFSTGNIAPGETSEAVPFADSTGHSGLSYFCSYHDQMKGEIIVSGNEAANLALAQDEAATDYSVENWQSMRRHLIHLWVYDMADDYEHAIANSPEDERTKLLDRWLPILDHWRQELNEPNATIADRGVLNSAPEELLMVIGRRLRSAIKQVEPLVTRHPDPRSTSQVGGNPFGKAITVFQEPPNPTVMAAFGRESSYARVANFIETEMDRGVQVPTNAIDVYNASKAELSVDDYATLARHQVDGLRRHFGKTVYDDEMFAAGIWSMTYAGEWESPSYVGWHWLKWVDAYLGTLETGEVPDIIELPSS